LTDDIPVSPRVALAVLLVGVLAASAGAEPSPQRRRDANPVVLTLAPGFVAARIKSSDGHEQPYAVFIPERYDPDESWPLVVFLHGSGESGHDGIRQTRVGLGPFIERYRSKCPFIAVFPQSPDARIWFRGAQAKVVFEIIDQVQRDYRVDPDRIYLTGLSMGGFGTWEMAMMRPDLFAAIAPICGGGPVEAAARIRNLPVWAFHGALDDKVPVSLTRDMIKALKDQGGDPKYTEFPKLGHECWDAAYDTPGFFPWLLKQRRSKLPRVMKVALDRAWCPVPTRVRWLRIEAAEPDAKFMEIDAVVVSPTDIRLATTGIRSAALVFDRPIADRPDAPLKVLWNGHVAFHGEWQPTIELRPPTTTSSAPARP